MSEGQAELMKKTVPGVDCDNDDDDDDDSNEDDDNNDTDDSPSDDYWKCLKENGSSEKQCNDAGCAWCETKAGYGICLDEEAAKSASESDWFTCDISLHFKDEEEIVNDPMDPTCIYATLQGEEGCKVTTDGDGNTCEWCSVSGAEICLDADQASIAEQVGGDCGGRAVEGKEGVTTDPYDLSCLLATLQGGDGCTATADGDGNSCEWCSVSGAQVCVTSMQAGIVEQVLDGDCSDSLNDLNEEEIVNDPMDPTCIYATLQGEEGCKVTTDGDGNTCEWCSVSGAEICLDADQASIAEQVGGDCGGRAVEGKEEVVNDPFDASCLLATLQGKDSCNVATDGDGNSCEWCTVQGNPICLSSEQAEVAEQVGAICGESTVLSMQ